MRRAVVIALVLVIAGAWSSGAGVVPLLSQDPFYSVPPNVRADTPTTGS